MIKKIPVKEAIGTVLAHDLTRIVPNVCKETAFKKGHIIKAEDLPLLLSMGKEHVYSLKLSQDKIHENDAALKLSQLIAGEGLKASRPMEGKVNLRALHQGILKINTSTLFKINCLGEIAVSTRHSNQLIKENELVASVKVIPLILDKQILEKAERLLDKPLINVFFMPKTKVAVIITGSEVYHKRIEDQFLPVIMKKIADYHLNLVQEVEFCPDDALVIQEAIKRALNSDAQIIIVAGGMSVDPDDVTPIAIRQSGANVAIYGTPILPGAMFMLAYHQEKTIIGLPACGMYNRITAFDIVLPRVLLGEKLNREDIAALGHGGLCLNCPECTFPKCEFGR